MPKLALATAQPAAAPDEPAPFWQSPDDGPAMPRAALWHGHVVDVLRRMPAGAVQCCVTSPPYWGLRDYQTATWIGGDTNHAHSVRDARGVSGGDGKQWTNRGSNEVYSGDCLCGAHRVDRQIGSEPSPDCGTHGQAGCGACFVCSMVTVFREVRRVLRDDGVLWLNLGDTFSSAGYWPGDVDYGTKSSTNVGSINRKGRSTLGLPPGNLVGVPWRCALALQADGWILRSDVPWVKRASMPESADNRPNKALEYFFMLVKGPDYFFDMDAIRRPSPAYKVDRINREKANGVVENLGSKHGDEFGHGGILGHQHGAREPGRNFRNADLWFQSVSQPFGVVGAGDELVGFDVTGGGYKGAHFATFSPKLIEPMILAGTSEYGACASCGAPWQRVVDRERADSRVSGGGNCIGKQGHDADGTGAQQEGNYRQVVSTTTLGWEPTCRCGAKADVVPCVVLDPFVGSGTTCALSLTLGRSSWGIDLSAEYLGQHAKGRITEAWGGPRRVRGSMERVGRALPVGLLAPVAARVKLGR